MDNINDILRAKRIVRQNGYTIKKPARDYDYEREDRMNLIRAKRIVKDAGYSYVKPNDGVSDNSDDFDTVPTRRRYQDDFDDDLSVRRRLRPSEDDSFATRRQRLERPALIQSGDEPNFPGRRRMREPIKSEGEPAPATEDKPRQKTRQEIYQDIAAKYV